MKQRVNPTELVYLQPPLSEARHSLSQVALQPGRHVIWFWSIEFLQ